MGKRKSSSLTKAIGIFLFLLILFTLLSPASLFRAVAFPLLYLLGGVGFWIVLPLLAIACLLFAFAPVWLRLKVRFYIGGVLLILAIGMSITFAYINSGDNVIDIVISDDLGSMNPYYLEDVSSFTSFCINQFKKGNLDPSGSLLAYGGGLFAYSLYQLFNSLGVSWLYIVLFALFYLGFLLLFFLPEFIRLGKYASYKKLVKKEKKALITPQEAREDYVRADKANFVISEASIAPSKTGPRLAPNQNASPYFSPAMTTPKLARFVPKGNPEEEKETQISPIIPPYQATPAIIPTAELELTPEPTLEEEDQSLPEINDYQDEHEEVEDLQGEIAEELESHEEPLPSFQEAPKEESIDSLLDNYPYETYRQPYNLPPLDILYQGEENNSIDDIEEEASLRSSTINRCFAAFSIRARVIGHTIGPAFTRYDIETDDDVSVASIPRYLTDIEKYLGGVDIRFLPVVVGSPTSAFEIANSRRIPVSFKELLLDLPSKEEPNLYVTFGKAISGENKGADMAKFPHMIVAGTTGSGKSIFLSSLIMSLLMRNRPDDVKLVLVDPKMVEMKAYEKLPHLLTPVITEAKKAKVCFKKLCDEMDKRYLLFAASHTRDIDSFNSQFALPNGRKRMPYIVVFIDEYSDLVSQEKDIQNHVLRIGQKARAAGIYMCIATQRPEVKVITGTIKANMPVRVALTVTNTIDSTTILDESGAENLTGNGDMLILCPEIQRKGTCRLQGCLVRGEEIRAVTEFIQNQQRQVFDPEFIHLEEEDAYLEAPSFNAPNHTNNDEVGYIDPGHIANYQEMREAQGERKYQLIKQAVMDREFTSVSQIQRDYSVGFNKAGKIFARLVSEGVIEPAEMRTDSHGSRVLKHDYVPPENDIVEEGEEYEG